ncbi:hypothetical protein [Halobaculum sp. MBLA0143]|uniref:hypothetical protein n=1 Tax=Halobaculum sp. MBLA0143 TaxID=3079933 RepID=UPI0035257687
MSQQKNTNGRRRLLQTGAAAFDLSGTAVLGSAERTFDEIYAQARRIRSKTSSREKFVDYLRRHTTSVKTRSESLGYSPNTSSDEAGAQRFYADALTIDTTLTYQLDCNDGQSYAYIDYTFDLDPSSFITVGSDKEDRITLSWNDSHYRTEEDTQYVDNAPNISFSSFTLSGVDFKFDDEAACLNGCDITGNSVGTKMQLLDTSQERAVQSRYHHTWNGLEYKGFSVKSSGAVSWSFAPTDYGEVLDTTITEGNEADEGICGPI